MDSFDRIAEEIRAQLTEARTFRGAVVRALSVAREADLVRQREVIAADIVDLMDADVVRIYAADDEGRLSPLDGPESLPADAVAMERELLARAPLAG